MKTEDRHRLGYLACDYVAANIGWLLFTVVRYFSLPYNWLGGDLGSFLVRGDILLGQLVVPLCMLILYAISGAYNKSKTSLRSRLDEVLNTVVVSGIATIGIFFTAMIDDNIPERLTSYELIIILFLCLSVPDSALRLIHLGRHLRRVHTGHHTVPAIILGVSPKSEQDVDRLIKESRRTGITPVACTKVDGLDFDGTLSELPVYNFDDIPELIKKYNIGATVVMCFHGSLGVSTDQLGRLYMLDIPIYITPDAYSVSAIKPRFNSVVTEPLVDISCGSISAADANLKRLTDIVVSAFALVLLSPLYLLLAIGVKSDSPGPVFYRQERIGYRRKPFNILKFRTMVVDAEKGGPQLTLADDNRVTRFGRILRRYRLDELPQFWNVFKGEMSLVGPRPERACYISQIIQKLPAYGLLHQVRPGITSWGMVKFGYANTVEQMVNRATYDLLYINNVSLGVDLKILFHTVSTVLTGRGM